jgi:hypothetical protein
MKSLFCLILVSCSLFGSEYAVRIDSGSGGSRAYLFEINNLEIKLIDKLEIEPGISSFSRNLTGLKTYLPRLTNFARSKLPTGVSPKEVPLKLEATGGVRALKSAEQQRLMKYVQGILKQSGFKDPQAVTITGVEEGVFQWESINYLLGTLDSGNTVGLIEMGGASVQVTFQKGEKLYSKTYDGLGETHIWNKNAPIACKNIPTDYKKCKNSLEKKVVHFKPIVPSGSFYWVDNFIQLEAVLKLPKMSRTILDARGPDACKKSLKDLQKDVPGGAVKYLKRICFDVAYMSIVLERLGFPEDFELSSAKKIGNTPVNWTLGSLRYELGHSQKPELM